MKLLQVAEQNKKYYTKDFIHGFNTGAKTQYESDSKEQLGRWVPVTERLPEKVGDYPVTCLDGGRQIDLGQWCIDECGEGFWVCDWCDANSVIAWMPLPAPYEGGDEE